MLRLGFSTKFKSTAQSGSNHFVSVSAGATVYKAAALGANKPVSNAIYSCTPNGKICMRKMLVA